MPREFLRDVDYHENLKEFMYFKMS